MLTQEKAEKIVRRFSPTTKVSVRGTSKEGIYLEKTNEIIISENWTVAGLLHEITHAILFLDSGRTGHDGVFADKFTKLVGIYFENNK